MPASRAARISRQTKSTCPASSRTATSAGRAPAGRSLRSRLAKPSPASAITALAAVEDLRRRAVVLLQRDDARRRSEQAGEVEDVADLGGAEGVDRLRVVADHGHPAAVGLQPGEDRRLQPVGVLVLVDQHMVEPPADLGRELRRPASSRPSRAGGRRSRAPRSPASPRRRPRRAARSSASQSAHQGKCRRSTGPSSAWALTTRE